MAERFAIISDIHANIEALGAVLADIEARGVDEIVCLGDIVGYGVDAEACLDVVRTRCAFCLCGNHDWSMINSAIGFNPVAKQAIDLTRERLQPGPLSLPATRRRWEFAANLPYQETREGKLFVHGSPRDPVMEYIFPEDVDVDPDKMTEIFEAVERACFIGHTHLPGVFTDDMDFRRPAEIGDSFLLGDRKAVINVGSVGQPRDGDVRASYAEVSEDLVVFRRVEYDVQKTMEKIRASHIDDLCAERLSLGK
ncbi:metallophosphoesterase family protein [bacterium]|nr:metallophosphoesterase family protein [bacterium]